ncbi:MSHA biogenesis protein MshN [Vibrio halioticoli NBRC 102217]|uniref:MSHA biogenesis protein MshN n=1 Tax=Vibrio halioticoli NBRC 102217 TaxID=1219072 RepID=V5FE74_9VIBR|nr:tetratricopeptide repeat protein [Vibrio halioticoli]GAD88146.1 MSHA biogenesis protein MshN [Vibrio halioticoli NBRC 102217]
MSVVNSALSKLADNDKPQGQSITKAEVPKIKRSKPLVWLIAGFTISMAIGGWAVSQQEKDLGYSTSSDAITTKQESAPETTVSEMASQQPSQPSAEQAQPMRLSPTHSKVQQSVKIHSAQPIVPVADPVKKEATKQTVAKVSANEPKAQPVVVKAKTVPVKVKPAPAKTTTAATQPKPVAKTARVKAAPIKAQTKVEEPILLAKVNTPTSQESVTVEHVELTHRELADKSVAIAEKAIDSNDVNTAFTEYNKALRLVPGDENIRQKLAALYYGRKDLRKAATTLQDGIRLNDQSEALRYSLAKLLIKEQQPEAALSVLITVPKTASNDYLALRAGLAQEVKNTDVALESYQILSEKDPKNARWWLGLGISQERSLDYKNAQVSYTKAIGLVGVSSKTQSFIRDRLKLLKSLEGDDSGN